MENEMRKDIDRVKNFGKFINENTNMKDITHNLEVAKPNFLFFIKNMDKELSQWIQYNGVEIDGSKIFFKFKSSQNSLNFKVYGGVNINDIYYLLNGKSNEIYDFFKKLKYDNFMEVENVPLKEMIEKIQKPQKDYDEYVKNSYTFFPESCVNFFNRLFKN